MSFVRYYLFQNRFHAEPENFGGNSSQRALQEPGQKSNVIVHRFITKGTFEERINEMIQKKKHLADITAVTGENWIGNLSNKEIRDLFDLNRC